MKLTSSRIPTIHQYGDARPREADLAGHRLLASKILQQVFPGSDPDATPMPYPQALRLILPNADPAQKIPGRLARLFRNDIDVIEPDGKISLAEWSLYFYRLSRLDNNTPQITSQSMALGRGLSDKHYLLERAKDCNLGKKMVNRLEALLASNRFTATRPLLADCFDLACRQTEALQGSVKAMQVAKNVDEMTESLSGASLNLKAKIAHHLLKLFTRTANMPSFNPNAPSATPELQQFIVKSQDGGNGNSRQILYQSSYTLTPEARNPFRKKPIERLGTFPFKSPESYRIIPDEIRADSSSMEGKALYQAMQQQSHRMVTALQKHAASLLDIHQNIFEIFDDGQAFYRAIEPIYNEIKASLALPGLRLWICDTITDEQQRPLEVLGLFQPECQGEDDIAPIPTIAVSREGFIDHGNALLRQGLSENAVRDHLWTRLIETLVEESVHAKQQRLAAGPLESAESAEPFTVKRLQDYRDNLPLMIVPDHAAASMMGDKRFYHQQPIEFDAKWIADAVGKALLTVIQQPPEPVS